MTRVIVGMCVLAALIASPGPVAAAQAPRPYVVVYDTQPRDAFSVQAETAARERALGFDSKRRFRHALDGFAARLTAADVRALRADRDVALVAPDRELRAARVPLAPGETVPTGVARIGAAGPAGVHGASASPVAVLDTGIDLSNPQLVVEQGPNCTGAGPPQDDDGHGTHVAGVIGAHNDGSGVVGVAPGTELWAVKVLSSSGAGLVSEIICGIDWVTAYGPWLGIRVANMSLSGAYPPDSCEADPLHRAVCNSAAAGIVYTAAAGNAATDVAAEIPGSYPEVLTVTAAADTDGRPGGAGADCDGEVDDTSATFSNYAVRPADIAHVVAAPGVCIESTARGGGLLTQTGTSAAAPHVAGVAAVCMGEPGHPGPCAAMTAPEVIEQIRADAAANATPANGFRGDPFTPGGDHFFGHLVSAHDPSVRRIASRTTAPPAASAPQPQADLMLELLALRIAGRQRVGKLRVAVRLAERGTINARARVRLPRGAARVIRSRVATAAAEPNVTRRLWLRFSRADVRPVRRVLRRGRRLRARISVTVRDAAGNVRTSSRRVRLRP